VIEKQFIFNCSYDHQMKSGKEAESEKELETEAKENNHCCLVQEFKHDKEREFVVVW
jgi:hypothetical protein